MNNGNPVPSLETETEPMMESESIETEQVEGQKEGSEKVGNVTEPEERHADNGMGAEKIKEEEAETDEEMQEQQEKQDSKDRKWGSFGYKEPEIRKCREEYAHDLGMPSDFGIKECEAKKGELSSGENNGKEAERKNMDDFREALKLDVSQMDKESAALMIGEFELLAKECGQEAEFAKINYLLKLEECLNAEGDDKKEKVEEFISKDHPNRLEEIIILKTVLKGINKKLEELREKAAEKDAVITQGERSEETQQEGSAKKDRHLGERFLNAGKGLLLIGGGSIYMLLKRLFGEGKMDDIMKKITGKPVPEWAKSKKQSK